MRLRTYMCGCIDSIFPWLIMRFWHDFLRDTVYTLPNGSAHTGQRWSVRLRSTITRPNIRVGVTIANKNEMLELMLLFDCTLAKLILAIRSL